MLVPKISIHKRKQQYESEQGFTLIEVLVALFIIATCLTMLLELSTTIANSAILGRDRVNGLYVLENYVTEKRIDKKNNSVTAGTETVAYQWNGEQYSIRETRTATKNDFIVKVELVALNSNNKEIANMLTYYVANPLRQ